MNFKMLKGFTLIELLVVIGILAVLAAGVVALINPQDKLYAANDSKVQSDIGELATGSQAYAATHNGFFPAAAADLVTSGDLGSAPTPPTGYGAAYGFAITPAGCSAGVTCTSVIITGTLKSKKYAGATPATPVWRWESSTGKTCTVATTTTACP